MPRPVLNDATRDVPRAYDVIPILTPHAHDEGLSEDLVVNVLLKSALRDQLWRRRGAEGGKGKWEEGQGVGGKGESRMGIFPHWI